MVSASEAPRTNAVTTEAHARERLAVIFRGLSGRDAHDGHEPLPVVDFPSEEVLQLVKTHTTLAVEYFDDETGQGRVALSYFIAAHSDFESIQEIHQYTTNHCDSITDSVEFGAFIDACIFGCHADVLELFLRRRPFRLNEVDHDGRTPAKIILENGLGVNRTNDEKLEILKLFVEADPYAMMEGYSGDGSDILDEALRGQYGTPIMHFLFGEYAKYIEQHADSEWLQMINDDALNVGHQQAMALALVLEKIQSFQIAPGSFGVDGFICLMDAIMTNSSIDSIDVALPTELFAEETVKNAFHYAMVGNSSLQHFEANQSRERNVNRQNEDDDNCFNAVIASLAANTSIEDASFRNFRLSQSQSLAGFLSDCNVPNITLGEFQFATLNHDFHFTPECKLQQLQLSSNLGADWCSKLITCVDQIPKLDSLLLIHRNAVFGEDIAPFDLSKSLAVSIGRQGYEGRLVNLVLANTVIDLEVVAMVLKNNIGLRELNIQDCNMGNYKDTLGCVAEHLEHHSSSLTCVYTTYSGYSGPGDEEDYYEIPKELNKIDYLVALNRDGRRAKAMSEQTTLTQLIDLLCDVISTPRVWYFDGPLERSGGDCKHNIQYGLLRIAPHLWSKAS